MKYIQGAIYEAAGESRNKTYARHKEIGMTIDCAAGLRDSPLQVVYRCLFRCEVGRLSQKYSRTVEAGVERMHFPGQAL